ATRAPNRARNPATRCPCAARGRRGSAAARRATPRPSASGPGCRRRRRWRRAARRSSRYVARAAVGPEDEVALVVGHVVERHGGERLEERDATLGDELVLGAAVDDDHVARPQRPPLVADRD